MLHILCDVDAHRFGYACDTHTHTLCVRENDSDWGVCETRAYCVHTIDSLIVSRRWLWGITRRTGCSYGWRAKEKKVQWRRFKWWEKALDRMATNNSRSVTPYTGAYTLSVCPIWKVAFILATEVQSNKKIVGKSPFGHLFHANV